MTEKEGRGKNGTKRDGKEPGGQRREKVKVKVKKDP